MKRIISYHSASGFMGATSFHELELFAAGELHVHGSLQQDSSKFQTSESYRLSISFQPCHFITTRHDFISLNLYSSGVKWGNGSIYEECLLSFNWDRARGASAQDVSHGRECSQFMLDAISTLFTITFVADSSCGDLSLGVFSAATIAACDDQVTFLLLIALLPSINYTTSV